MPSNNNLISTIGRYRTLSWIIISKFWPFTNFVTLWWIRLYYLLSNLLHILYHPIDLLFLILPHLRKGCIDWGGQVFFQNHLCLMPALEHRFCWYTCPLIFLSVFASSRSCTVNRKDWCWGIFIPERWNILVVSNNGAWWGCLGLVGGDRSVFVVVLVMVMAVYYARW